MNASLESFLKGYNDPRLKSYFNPAQDGRDKDGNINREVAGVKQLSSIEDEYKGVRQGTGVADNRYSTSSPVLYRKAASARRNHTSAALMTMILLAVVTVVCECVELRLSATPVP